MEDSEVLEALAELNETRRADLAKYAAELMREQRAERS
jgi:hypothetical protein